MRMKTVLLFIDRQLLAVLMVFILCACGSTKKDENALTDEKWARVQAIFTEYVGKEIENKPVYCGEWREGRQYKTENYAYGQYLINMDDDGYVHLIVWVQDKAGSEGRTVMYNRLNEER